MWGSNTGVNGMQCSAGIQAVPKMNAIEVPRFSHRGTLNARGHTYQRVWMNALYAGSAQETEPHRFELRPIHPLQDATTGSLIYLISSGLRKALLQQGSPASCPRPPQSAHRLTTPALAGGFRGGRGFFGTAGDVPSPSARDVSKVLCDSLEKRVRVFQQLGSECRKHCHAQS